MSDLTLVTFGPAWGLPFQGCGPFCMKLESWLRLADIAYSSRIENNPGRGPKGKSPWIETAEGTMGDSELIIKRLKSRRGVDPDAELTPARRAEGAAWRRLWEEHYHQVWEYLTFLTQPGLDSAQEFFDQLPAVLRPVIRRVMLRSLRKQLEARGIGRHAHDDVVAMGIEDIDAAALHLGDEPFWLGDEPTTTDCAAFAFLAVTVWTPSVSLVHERARGHENLVSYCERMGQRLFPERMDALRAHAARPSTLVSEAA